MTDEREAWAEAIGGRLTERLTALEKLTEERFSVQERALAAALAAVQAQNDLHAASHAREHTAQQMAIDKADKRIDERFLEANQFRKQLESERIDYVRRDMLDQRVQTIEIGVDQVRNECVHRTEKLERERIAPVEEWRANVTGKMAVWALVGAFGSALFSSLIVVAILSLVGR